MAPVRRGAPSEAPAGRGGARGRTAEERARGGGEPLYHLLCTAPSRPAARDQIRGIWPKFVAHLNAAGIPQQPRSWKNPNNLRKLPTTENPDQTPCPVDATSHHCGVGEPVQIRHGEQHYFSCVKDCVTAARYLSRCDGNIFRN